MKESHLSADGLRELVKEQCRRFPTAGEFDYRELGDQQSPYKILGQYLQPRLVGFLEQFGHIHSSPLQEKKSLQLQMLVALLCNVVDRRSCFLQTLIGLFAYANGLRDKGSKLIRLCFFHSAY